MDICLIYFSSSLKLSQEKDLLELLQQSREHNREVGITGVLLYVQGQIMQVLEGSKQVVEDLFKRIEIDTRHTNVSMAINRPIKQRLFPNWTMGYKTITHSKLEDIKAIISLPSSKGPVMILSDNPILKALQVFYDGNRYNERF